MIAIDYDFLSMLKFLQQEVGLSLYAFNYGGQSSLEIAFEKASFYCFCYLIDYYINFALFEIYNDFSIIERVLSGFIEALDGRFYFTSGKASVEMLKENFKKSIPGKKAILDLSFVLFQRIFENLKGD